MYIGSVLPHPNEPTPEELRREKVMKILNGRISAREIYEHLLEADLLK